MRTQKRIIIVFSVFFLIIAGLGMYLRSQYVIPILMYHTVYPNASYVNRLAVSTQTFERQMQFLTKHHYNVVTLEKIAELLSARKKIPAKTVSITLDDGYQDNYTYVFPILKKYHIPATIFIIANEVGRPGGDRLTWDEIKEMQKSGLVTFGSHTLGPEPLTEIPSQDEVKRQIFESKKILEQKLKRPVEFFCYPEGRFNAAIRQLVIDAGYRLALGTKPEKKSSIRDIFAIKRVRVSENAVDLRVFWWEVSGYYNFFRNFTRK